MGSEGQPRGGLGRFVIIDPCATMPEPDIVKRDPSLIIDEATRTIISLSRFDDLHPCKDSEQVLLNSQLEKSSIELLRAGLSLPEIELQIGQRLKTEVERNPSKK